MGHRRGRITAKDSSKVDGLSPLPVSSLVRNHSQDFIREGGIEQWLRKRSAKQPVPAWETKAVTFTGKLCPSCGGAMVATKFIKSEERPGGMYWVCPKDDQRIRI